MSVCQVEAATEIDVLAREMRSAHGRLLRRLAAVDATEGWRYDGAANAVAWLVARLGVSHATARSWVEVAGRLTDLPHLAAEYEAGGMSIEQLEAASRFATRDNDETLAKDAPQVPVTQLQREARRRERQKEAARPPSEQRRARFWHDHRAGMVRLQGSWPAADGLTLIKAVDRIADSLPNDPDRRMPAPVEQRLADALLLLASQHLGSDGDTERATIVVHIPADVSLEPDPMAETATGEPIPNPFLRRLACDSRLELAVENRGVAVGIGRASRRIPPWLERHVRFRDNGRCRFPGCEGTRWLQSHHQVHWIDGGPTDLDNLITLCGYHHRLIHEHGWRIAGDPNHDVSWIRPDGTVYDPRYTRFRQIVLAMSGSRVFKPD